MNRASSHSDCWRRTGCFWPTSASTRPGTSPAARYSRNTTVMRARVAGGVAVYLFMNFVVLPLSAVAQRPFVLELALVILAVHMVCVGLPIALAVRRWAPLRPAGERS